MACDELKNSVILVFANKQDKEDSMKISEIITKYNLNIIKDHVWHIQACSGKTGEGLVEGLEWLSSKIINLKDNKVSNIKYSNPNIQSEVIQQKLDVSSNIGMSLENKSGRSSMFTDPNKEDDLERQINEIIKK